ncbi:putative DNA-binding domain-containing protein [Rheinheimera sp.]|uniref:HvfC family RiPP maturation protein n=1 Tax=Rheinheimera sp. TaxID=1869214 RepID=UPI00307E3B60
MQFKQVQQQFVGYLRNASAIKPPVPDERLAVYQELLFNNVSGFIDSAYPVLKSLLDAERWLQLKRQFFADFRCSSPYFLHIAGQFLQFLQQSQTEPEPVFLVELAHYEWLELDVATRKTTAVQQQSNGIDGLLMVSELAEVQAYHYPVHQVCTDFQPTETRPTFLLLYRDNDDEVQFVELNSLSALLLQLLQSQPGLNFTELTAQLQQYLPALEKQQIESGARQLLLDFAAKAVVHTFQPA